MNVMKHVIRNNKFKLHNLSLLKLKLNNFSMKNNLYVSQKKFSSKNQNNKEEIKENNENSEKSEETENKENSEENKESESKSIYK